ncbi:hypothetical protein C8J57DRAFT_67226 [Mycena rebaudengoi]|nr:hypothetical protein C8J57DRAFT_67226 [Mycena rebaudengoi]
MGPPHSFVALLSFLAFLLLCAVPSAQSAVTTTTFDDTSSSFSFTGSWTATSASNPCDFCSSKPDPSRIFGETWHDGNFRSGADTGTGGSFTFTGSAVSIFGIDQAKSQPDIEFTLGSIKSVHHYEGTERFVYDALFFHAEGLAADKSHTVTWTFQINQASGVGVQAALFDRAVVTSGSDDVADTGDLVNKSQINPKTSSKSTTISSTTVSLSTSSSTSSLPTTKSGSNVKGLANGPSSSSDSNSSSSTATGLGNAPTPAGAAAEGTSHTGTSRTAAIVGAIVGVLILAMLFLIAFLSCRRRAQRARRREDEERAAVGLGPAPTGARRTRMRDFVPQPFVQSRPSSAHSPPVQSTSTSAPTMQGQNMLPVSAIIYQPERPPVFVDTALTAGGYPADVKTSDGWESSHPVTRNGSQSSQFSARHDDIMSPATIGYGKSQTPTTEMLLSPATSTARERYLEERLATLEAHVASYLPPPYNSQ